MNYRFLKIAAFTVLVVFSSCVSKKKFLEMQTGRMNAEEQVRKLDAENRAKEERIKALIADFETMKNELLENNAIKENYIDSLSGVIYTLSEKLRKQEESLQETSFTLDFEKQRLSDALTEKEKAAEALQRKVEQLEDEVAQKNAAIGQINFELGKAKDEAVVLNGKITAGERKIAELQAQLEKSRAEVKNLQEQIKSKDETITRLENNVKLLKKELGQ